MPGRHPCRERESSATKSPVAEWRAGRAESENKIEYEISHITTRRQVISQLDHIFRARKHLSWAVDHIHQARGHMHRDDGRIPTARAPQSSSANSIGSVRTINA